MSTPYPVIVAELVAEQAEVLSAFNNAQTELNSQGAPVTAFLEIYFDGSAILRLFDNTPVTGLTPSEQLRLYPQLGGLFNLAMRASLYP
jgi:hypothetical protein